MPLGYQDAEVTYLPAAQATPDAGHFRHGGLIEVSYLLPALPGGWRPVPTLTGFWPKGTTSSALIQIGTTTHRGCDALFIESDTEQPWAAIPKISDGKIALGKRPSVGLFDNVSKAGEYSATLAEFASQFNRFGEWVIWTNGIDDVQGYQVGTSALFEDLITSTYKPKAKLISPMFGTLPSFVLANLIEGATVFGDKVAWSAFDNVRAYGEPLAGEVADSQVLADDRGPIYGMARVGGNDGRQLFFKQNAIHFMVWPPAFNILSTLDGTRFPNSILEDGEVVWYWSTTHGPTRIVGGAQPEHVLEGSAYRRIFDPLFSDRTFVTGATPRDVWGAQAVSAGLKCWFLRSAAVTTPPVYLDLIVYYDPTTQRVGFSDSVLSSAGKEMALVGRGGPNPTLYPWSVFRDIVVVSRVAGGASSYFMESTNNVTVLAARPFSLRWPYWGLEDGTSEVLAVRPICTVSGDTGPIPFAATIHTKNGPMDVPTSKTSTTVSKDGGWIPVLGPQGHFHSVELAVTGTTHDPAAIDLVHGVEVAWRRAGAKAR